MVLWMLKIKTGANIIFLGSTTHLGEKATKLENKLEVCKHLSYQVIVPHRCYFWLI